MNHSHDAEGTGQTQHTGRSIERELTYLARALPTQIAGATPRRLLDVYVPSDPSVHPRLRLRKAGDTHEVTKKLPAKAEDASVHTEDTISLSAAEFDALAAASDRRVSKDRYRVMIDGHPCEVDVFLEGLAGLVLIDFEFDSEASMSLFEPPDVCLAEVTQEEFTAGGLLAGRSIEDLAAELARFGYEPIRTPGEESA